MASTALSVSLVNVALAHEGITVSSDHPQGEVSLGHHDVTTFDLGTWNFLGHAFAKSVRACPLGEIRSRHPLAVHWGVQGYGQDGNSCGTLRQTRVFLTKTPGQLVHGSLGHTITNHTWTGRQHCWFSPSEGDQATLLQEECSSLCSDGGGPHTLTPHCLTALLEVCWENIQ
ncbi:hypothetical protein E2C01_010132 [Portunus trituberculatus]|uniref:Uncharacterized protein n=1 Tax=Portunus trituberculatus TaxID=210409 RepID=A0A5B7D7T7_PORTR|nr:hypothetical protein [Portunus trituberculatus]